MPPAKKKQAVPTPAPLVAQGTGKKRTPQSAFDPAAGKDIYEPEKIVAQRGERAMELLLGRTRGVRPS